jgi:hypothetical protein
MKISLATLKRRLGPIHDRVVAQVKMDPLLAAYIPSLATGDGGGPS